MYLVLTALLALNVSAEIFNAFEMVDGGLKTANASLDRSNSEIPSLIKDAATKKSELQVYADKVDPAKSLSKEATDYIQDVIDKLVDEGGDRNGKHDEGDYITLEGGKRELVGKRNYDPTTRLMVDDGGGMELKAKMDEYKNKFIELIDEPDRAGFSLPIDIDDEAWKLSPNKKKNWADFTFGHMPIGATMPIFSKFINDIKASEAKVLNYLAGKVGVGGETIVLDKYRVVASPKQSYIIKGEQYEADVFLSAAAGGSSQTGISISVNGSPLRVDSEGNAKYVSTPGTTGQKSYTAAITVTDPVTGEKKTYKETFNYEVGERSIAVSATKMNVFYIGVDNPVEVSAAGVNSNDIQVSMGGAGGASIKPNADGTYTVNATRPTQKGEFAKVNVKAPGLSASKDFRVKRIPDPVPKLGKERGGNLGNGTFKAYPGVFPVLENFDFDARCNITDFLLIRTARRQDAEFAQNSGGKYSPQAQALVNKAGPGDTYIFNDIKCKCPGDPAPRNIGQMVFTIK
jgi:gliding motility-associated protein GldM